MLETFVFVAFVCALELNRDDCDANTADVIRPITAAAGKSECEEEGQAFRFRHPTFAIEQGWTMRQVVYRCVRPAAL